MNFQQLRIIREAARRDYNLTEVANALYTSQSGVSRHIRELEDELGIELFIRHGKRLLGMTEPGKELLVIAERMLNDANNIRKLADTFANRENGRLHVATTHTQARYALPRVVKEFRSQFPQVQLELNQAGPEEIVRLLQSGDSDIGISSERLDQADGIVAFHVSNRFLDLIPVVARLAKEQGAHAVLVNDEEEDDGSLRSRSDWVLVSRDRAALERPAIAEAGAEPAEDRPDWRTWTDDYSNLIQILK